MARLWTLIALAILAQGVAAQSAPTTAAPATGEPLPPLSLTDAEWMTHRIQLILERQGEGDPGEDLRLARLMLQAVIDFVELTIQRRSSLADYQFTYVGRDRIRTVGRPMDFSLDLEEPMSGVHVLGFAASRTPVTIHAIKLRTENGSVVLHPELVIEPDLAGRQFLYLAEPLTVTGLAVTAEIQEDRRPRLYVHLGRGPRPEYLRQAHHHLVEARGALEEDNIDAAAAEIELSRRLIAQALEGERP